MPPNFRRFLPLILIAALAILVLPALLRKHSSAPSASTKAMKTIDAMNLVDKGEQGYRGAHGRFTSHLADLVVTNSRLGSDLAIGLSVQLDVSADGRTFLARVGDDNLSLLLARTDGTIIARDCLVLKSASGVKCPPPVT